MLLEESLRAVFREIHSTMHNLAVGVSSSQVGKLRSVVSVEAFLMVTTVISIHVKVAAHLTELSAPLMVHHDLLFPACLSIAVWRTLCRLADSDGVAERETQRGRSSDGNFSCGFCTQTNLRERWWRGCLWSQKVERLRIMACCDLSVNAAW